MVFRSKFSPSVAGPTIKQQKGTYWPRKNIILFKFDKEKIGYTLLTFMPGITEGTARFLYLSQYSI
jgi:hypothetical protein